MLRSCLVGLVLALLVGCGGDDGDSQVQDIGPDGPCDSGCQLADADTAGALDTLDHLDAADTKDPADTVDTVAHPDTVDTVDPTDAASDTTDPAPVPWPPATMTEVPGVTPFFIDQYEWPNQAGLLPLGYVATRDAAASICAAVNKRLCAPAELAAACAPAATAYPYGATYAPAACNTELPYEADPCGANPDCHAPAAAAFDLVGNLAEWASDGTLFGGSVLDGLQGTCARFATPAQDADPRFFGLRCCLAADDDLDQDDSPASLDCNDGNAAIHPAAPEACNSLDDDCDGATDNTADQDKDGFNSCADCNDNAFSIHPGAPDEAGDQVDADCDGKDGSDNDGDGYFAGTAPGLDCNDQDSDISPAATELCNAKDDDCDGATDEALAPTICDDGNPCTDDLCDLTAGLCTHSATSCSDDSPCTDDTCDPALGCVFTPRDGACSDANPCTLQDACLAGLCLGMANPCDDDNPCTADTCDPATGDCNHDATEGPCQDADPCTLGDFCQDGLCEAGPDVLDCTDPNPCTDDTCTAGQGCLHAAITGPCDDGDSCTSSDMCMGTVCTGLNQCACATDDDCGPLNDANWCNGYLYCNTKASPAFCEVQPGSVVNCSTAQDSFCQAKTCDPLDGVCKLRPRNDGVACDAP
jgi:hypothetical protein